MTQKGKDISAQETYSVSATTRWMTAKDGARIPRDMFSPDPLGG
jgi:hypothetical protein